MKKLIILSLITLFSLSAYSQTCTTTTDKFTGKETKVGFISLISSFIPTPPLFGFAKVDTTYSLSFVFSAQLTADNFDKEKMMCMVRFSDGVIKKYHSNSISAISSTPTNGVMVAFYGTLSKEDLFYFRDNAVAAIRFSYKGAEDFGYDTNINESKAKKIIKAVTYVE
jgi:hypothetical protein